MDPYDGSRARVSWRSAVGADTRRDGSHSPALRALNLAAMTPADAVASTRYCLANPGQGWLPYGGGEGIGKSVRSEDRDDRRLDRSDDRTEPQWPRLHPGGVSRRLAAPMAGAAVLHPEALSRASITSPTVRPAAVSPRERPLRRPGALRRAQSPELPSDEPRPASRRGSETLSAS